MTPSLVMSMKKKTLDNEACIDTDDDESSSDDDAEDK